MLNYQRGDHDRYTMHIGHRDDGGPDGGPASRSAWLLRLETEAFLLAQVGDIRNWACVVGLSFYIDPISVIGHSARQL